MMVISLKSIIDDNNNNAEFTFVTGMKTKWVRPAAFVNKTPPAPVALLVILTDFTV